MNPIVDRLAQLIATHHWQNRFAKALAEVAAQDIAALRGLRTLDDYLRYIDEMVCWAPRESGDSRLVHDKLVEFHFVLDQPALRTLQSPIAPGASAEALTPLSQWICDYAKAWGSFLDQPASAARIASFRDNPAFCWDDYMPPPSGYQTFNQFFARHVKPGRRPVAAADDHRVVVSPVDAVLIGAWPIADDATIAVQPDRIDAKGMHWSVHELLADSRYADRFAGGLFMHSALRTFDYHRWHSPVAGRVLEARIVQGQAYLDVDVVERPARSGVGIERCLHAVEGTGYQFVQTRGLVVLDSPVGLVACLPVGMAQVSSVVITAEVGAELRKGEEMGYFAFGGSDFVMVFEGSAQLVLEAAADQHSLQGERLGTATARAESK